MLARYRRFEALAARLPEAAVLLAVRIAAAQPFWASGRSKVEGWFSFRPEVVDLFRDEYRLPLIPPEWAAPLTTVAEHALPLLLVLGLGTRGAALGLFIMTLVIQLLVYPDAFWPVHSLWFALLLVVLWRGGGAWSLERLLPGGTAG
jgi:putative oxidoreductase